MHVFLLMNIILKRENPCDLCDIVYSTLLFTLFHFIGVLYFHLFFLLSDHCTFRTLPSYSIVVPYICYHFFNKYFYSTCISLQQF